MLYSNSWIRLNASVIIDKSGVVQLLCEYEDLDSSNYQWQFISNAIQMIFGSLGNHAFRDALTDQQQFHREQMVEQSQVIAEGLPCAEKASDNVCIVHR